MKFKVGDRIVLRQGPSPSPLLPLSYKGVVRFVGPCRYSDTTSPITPKPG